MESAHRRVQQLTHYNDLSDDSASSDRPADALDSARDGPNDRDISSSNDIKHNIDQHDDEHNDDEHLHDEHYDDERSAATRCSRGRDRRSILLRAEE